MPSAVAFSAEPAEERRAVGPDDDEVRHAIKTEGGLGLLLRLEVHAAVRDVVPVVLVDELLGEVRIV